MKKTIACILMLTLNSLLISCSSFGRPNESIAIKQSQAKQTSVTTTKTTKKTTVETSKKNTAETTKEKTKETEKTAPSQADKLTIIVDGNKEITHDLDAAYEIAEDLLKVEILNFDLNEANRGNKDTIYLSAYAYEPNFKSLDKEKFIGSYALRHLVDKVNTYNANTYDSKSVYEKIKATAATYKMEYKELDESSKDYTDQELIAKFNQDMKDFKPLILYFKKDQNYVYQVPGGFGGVRPGISDKTDWLINQSTLLIPYNKLPDGSSEENQYTPKVILKINDKEYVGGEKKSKYYVYQIIE